MSLLTKDGQLTRFVEMIVNGTLGIIYRDHLLRIVQIPYMGQPFLES